MTNLETARNAVRAETFGTPAYDVAFDALRTITQRLVVNAPAEEFCSVDSGVHRTRLASGRKV